MKLNISYVRPCSESRFVARLDLNEELDLENIRNNFGGELSGSVLKTNIDGKDVLVFRDHIDIKAEKEHEIIKIIERIRNL